MRISYSALETFEQCPQKYKFQEIDRIKAPKSREALFGTAVHGALQYMFSKDPIFPTLEEVLAHFRDTFDQKKQIPEEDRKRYLEVGERMVASFYKANPPWNFTIIDLESRFEVTLVDTLHGKTHVLVGKIDRIDKLNDGTYEIIDYKTSRKLPSQEAVDQNLQLTIYQLGLQKRWPNLDPGTIKLSLYYLKAEEKFSTKRSKESLEKAETKLLEKINNLESKAEQNQFPPIPSALCEWCGYKSICPAWRHLYEKSKDPSREIAIEEAINQYFSLKKEIDERKKKLATMASIIHEYMNTEKLERVFGEPGSIMRSAQERAVWDTEKIKTILAGNSILPDIMVVDPKKLTRVMTAIPQETQEQLMKEARTVKVFTALKTSTKKIVKT